VEKGRAKRIFRLTFPARILERVMEILDLVDVDIRGAEKEIARLVLEVVEGLEEDEISFDEADRIFTALLALKTVELSEEIEEMLTLANELHDGNWETVAMLKNLAREVVTNV
jgi:predicted HTH domain antitoxin